MRINRPKLWPVEENQGFSSSDYPSGLFAPGGENGRRGDWTSADLWRYPDPPCQGRCILTSRSSGCVHLCLQGTLGRRDVIWVFLLAASEITPTCAMRASSSPRLSLTDGETKPPQAPDFGPARCACCSWDSLSLYSCLCPFPSVPGSEFLQGIVAAGTEAQLLALRISEEPAGTVVFGSRSKTESSVCRCCSLRLGCG